MLSVLCFALVFLDSDSMQMGNARFAEHNFVEARKAFEKATIEQPESFAAWRALGLTDVELQNYQGAYQAWLKADAINSKDAKTKYLLGRLFYEADLPNEAASYLRQALALAPDDFAAMTYLGLSAEALGFDGTASGLYRNAVFESCRQRKPYSWAYLALSKLLVKQGHETDATAALEEAEQKCPEAHALAELGGLLLKRGFNDRAEAALRRSIALDPLLSQPHYRLSLLLRSAGKAAEAQAEIVKFRETKAKEAEIPKVHVVRK